MDKLEHNLCLAWCMKHFQVKQSYWESWSSHFWVLCTLVCQTISNASHRSQITSYTMQISWIWKESWTKYIKHPLLCGLFLVYLRACRAIQYLLFKGTWEGSIRTDCKLFKHIWNFRLSKIITWTALSIIWLLFQRIPHWWLCWQDFVIGWVLPWLFLDY